MSEIETVDTVLRLETASRVLALDESARTVKHIISTAALDRNGRVVEPSGWKLAKFKANPIVLADHEYSIEKVIGRASDTRVEGEALISTTTFAQEGLGNVAFRLVQAGLANAWSVGWIGLNQHVMGQEEGCETCAAVMKQKKKDPGFMGRHYMQSELLEYSLVAIPANPEAIMMFRTAGLVATDEADAWIKATSQPEPEKPEAEAEPAPIFKPVERSAEFYRSLFSAARSVQRRNALRQTSAQFRRRVSHG